MNAKAKAQNVPEIPFDSVPNFLKLPPNLYLGEGIGVATNSKGHIFVYTRSQETRGCSSSIRTGVFVREIGEGLYGFAFAHAVRVDPQDNIWAVDEGTNMVIKFNPEGRVVMLLGRRPESVEGILATPGAGKLPSLRRSPIHLQPADRCGLGRGREYLRFRRLRQLARREVRQERAIHHDGGDQGLGARPTQPAALDRDRRQGQRLRGRPQQPAHSGVRQRPDLQGDLRSGGRAVGGLHYAGAASVSLQLQLEPGQQQFAEIAAVTGEIYKMELDGTILGKFGKAGKQLGEFSTVHEIDCRNENELLVVENHGLARAEADAASEKVGPEVTDHDDALSLLRHACCSPARFWPRAVPEIPYDSAPNLLKLPEHIYLGEAAGVATNSKGNIFVYTRTGASATTASRIFTHGGARLFEFDPNGNFVREIGQGLYGFLFAHVVRVDPQDNIWVVDEGSNMVIKFDPEGRVVMTMGRKPESVNVRRGGARRGRRRPGGGGGARRRGCGARGSGRQLQSADRCGLGRGRQYFRLRRLRQLARREVRQERQVHQVVGLARDGARPVQHAALDRDRRPGQRVRGRSRQQADSGLRQQRDLQDAVLERGRPLGHLHFSWAAPVSLQFELERHRQLDGQRRDLQDGAGREDRGQVRQGGQADEGVRHGA